MCLGTVLLLRKKTRIILYNTLALNDQFIVEKKNCQPSLYYNNVTGECDYVSKIAACGSSTPNYAGSSTASSSAVAVLADAVTADCVDATTSPSPTTVKTKKTTITTASPSPSTTTEIPIPSTTVYDSSTVPVKTKKTTIIDPTTTTTMAVPSFAAVDSSYNCPSLNGFYPIASMNNYI